MRVHVCLICFARRIFVLFCVLYCKVPAQAKGTSKRTFTTATAVPNLAPGCTGVQCLPKVWIWIAKGHLWGLARLACITGRAIVDMFNY